MKTLLQGIESGDIVFNEEEYKKFEDHAGRELTQPQKEMLKYTLSIVRFMDDTKTVKPKTAQILAQLSMAVSAEEELWELAEQFITESVSENKSAIKLREFLPETYLKVFTMLGFIANMAVDLGKITPVEQGEFGNGVSVLMTLEVSEAKKNNNNNN